MISSGGTPSTRHFLKDQHLAFNCGQFSRSVKSGRPLSRREVSAKECLYKQSLYADDTQEICDPTRLYTINFYETSDEEQAKRQRDLSNKYPDDIPLDRIGVFDADIGNKGTTSIAVSPHFMDTLWNAALAADGVFRSIGLTVQPAKRGGGWDVFEVSLSEEMADFFEWPLDKDHNPKFAPPRQNPTVVELRGVRADLRSLLWSMPGLVSGVMINMASAGIGTSTHVFGELFKTTAGVDLAHFPYRGNFVPDLIGGQVQVVFAPITHLITFIRSGQVRALAVATATRSEALPDPDLAEFVPGYEAAGWYGIGAPKGTPAEVIDRLNKETGTTLADQEFSARLIDLAAVPMPMTR